MRSSSVLRTQLPGHNMCSPLSILQHPLLHWQTPPSGLALDHPGALGLHVLIQAALASASHLFQVCTFFLGAGLFSLMRKWVVHTGA
jgi:hypothetical protein